MCTLARIVLSITPCALSVACTEDAINYSDALPIKKSKTIRQLAPLWGKMTNTEGQVGEVEIIC